MEELWSKIRQIFEGMMLDPATALADVAQLVQAAETAMSELPGEWHSFGHVTEQYYYDYFCGGEGYQAAPVNVGEIWRFFGSKLWQAGQQADAREAFTRALRWNPVDVESMLALGECCKHARDLEKFWEVTDEMYDLCNTRALLARYYRNLGFYYVEKYQPDLAEALYLYSELYCPTEGAQNELKFLAEALERPTPLHTEEELRAILERAEIPREPSAEMLALTQQAATDCEDAGRYAEAAECYFLLYDVTGSPEALARMEELMP